MKLYFVSVADIISTELTGNKRKALRYSTKESSLRKICCKIISIP